jgi:hypothetical protein
MLTAGQRIAHFEVLEKLGAGGMGVAGDYASAVCPDSGALGERRV